MKDLKFEINPGTYAKVIKKTDEDTGWISMMDDTIGQVFEIIAYNKDIKYLKLRTCDGKFRPDLWYHLNDLEIIKNECNSYEDIEFNFDNLF